VTSAIDAYAFGNCTYYVATRFPNIYPYLGNAKDWIVNAKKQGYQILSKPQPDTVVVYGPGNGYSALGHVAVVDSVNADGTFTVSEMNYKGYDVTDTRVSTMQGVIGFIVPPGSSFHGAEAQQVGTGVANCVTSSSWSILGQSTSICWDGLIGVGAMAAGGILIAVGLIVLASFTLKNSGIGNKVAGALPLIGGPVGAAVTVAEASKPKPKPSESAPSQEAQDAAHNERMSKAKARMSEAPQPRAKKEPPAIVGYNEQRKRESA
jgi:CHAP domain